MNNSIYQRIEIVFWDFAIHMMSENQTFRSMIQQGSRIVHQKEFKMEVVRTAGLLAVGAVAGLVCGLLWSVANSFIQ